MAERALVVLDSSPPAVFLAGEPLPDNASFTLGQTLLFARCAPWWGNFDLLVDPEESVLAGIVYPVEQSERAAVRRICDRLDSSLVRYCVPPLHAAALLEHGKLGIDALPRDWGDPNAAGRQFPEPLRPLREQLRAMLAGTADRTVIPAELRGLAADYFQALGTAPYLQEWPGGDVDRVEIAWLHRPVDPRLPPHFPWALEFRMAQLFAEDLWLYRQSDGGFVGLALNHIDDILQSFDVRLPPDVCRISL